MTRCRPGRRSPWSRRGGRASAVPASGPVVRTAPSRMRRAVRAGQQRSLPRQIFGERQRRRRDHRRAGGHHARCDAGLPGRPGAAAGGAVAGRAAAGPAGRDHHPRRFRLDRARRRPSRRPRLPRSRPSTARRSRCSASAGTMAARRAFRAGRCPRFPAAASSACPSTSTGRKELGPGVRRDHGRPAVSAPTTRCCGPRAPTVSEIAVGYPQE